MTDEPGSPAVFFDRDGTLMEDVDYCADPRDVRVFLGAREALQRLKRAGFRVIIITNQSGIGRGYFNEEAYRAVHTELCRQLGDDIVDASYHCPHAPDDRCECRKPSPQMVIQAEREHHIDVSRSYFVGDKASDVECGRNAGLRTILLKTGYGDAQKCSADWSADDLQAATDIILRNA